MKNLFSLITLATILFFTSCGKEELIQPEHVSETRTANYSETMLPAETNSEIFQGSFGETSQVEVATVNSSIVGGKLSVNFTSAQSFFNIDLVENQTLSFVDGSGNESTLPFAVDGHNYSNGVLSVDFTIGGNNLSGWDLKVVQYIIIHDDVME